MSSVNFEKIKQNGKPVSAYIRHNDSSERLKHEHSNKDINKDLTSGNVDWKGIDYNAAQERYKARIAELDKVEGQNKRKDRVVAFSLCVPIPKDVSDKKAFFNDVMELFSKDFGERNINTRKFSCEMSMLLRCSEEYVRRIAHEGRISFQKNGKNMVFRKRDVLSYLDENF